MYPVVGFGLQLLVMKAFVENITISLISHFVLRSELGLMPCFKKKSFAIPTYVHIVLEPLNL